MSIVIITPMNTTSITMMEKIPETIHIPMSMNLWSTNTRTRLISTTGMSDKCNRDEHNAGHGVRSVCEQSLAQV